ncbi:hypothetical protein TNCT_580211 [Trichonephila clavata]|uniref:Uncharacterized protein n=1 Tax=Trichonephila clavata TaxID=2740835 RepID=A0A8X6IBJ0_TRICU|nr:hypothetical protein TNCT_580211 [Trichonephila clavata]
MVKDLWTLTRGVDSIAWIVSVNLSPSRSLKTSYGLTVVVWCVMSSGLLCQVRLLMWRVMQSNSRTQGAADVKWTFCERRELLPAWKCHPRPVRGQRSRGSCLKPSCCSPKDADSVALRRFAVTQSEQGQSRLPGLALVVRVSILIPLVIPDSLLLLHLSISDINQLLY